MKYAYPHIFIILCFLISTSQAQTAEEIVDCYLEKSGGIENLKALKATKINASIKSEGREIPLEIYNTRSGKQAVIININGESITQFAFDGEIMWTTDMLTGIPEKGLQEVTENIKLTANDFPTPFLNYREKGYTLEYLGETKFDKDRAHKIRLIQEPIFINGQEQESFLVYYFDKKTSLPIGKASEITVDGQLQEVNESRLSNYKEVSGLLFPFTVIESGQKIKIKNIVLNHEIDPAIFTFPTNQSN
ncbi:outer membrane lipoprotein-sorting protein [Antarcticibacterium arcticum]|uniref:Outer membrane lipoprotein-sorting protein n=1 Tax=Antarcticibacterium arcticum TaxID=2585771 RepID=A0A5B8YL53_9FLAO|nr:outer membrane lipoprotein-sorting protein [Antarcticibacterium arcticum]QED37046.1 outer membrane lipoprotein-sorting protein [Antarcticibacterium arcticum]